MTSVESMHTFFRIIKERMKERKKKLHKTKLVRGVCCVCLRWRLRINQSKKEKAVFKKHGRKTNKERKKEKQKKVSKTILIVQFMLSSKHASHNISLVSSILFFILSFCTDPLVFHFSYDGWYYLEYLHWSREYYYSHSHYSHVHYYSHH